MSNKQLWPISVNHKLLVLCTHCSRVFLMWPFRVPTFFFVVVIVAFICRRRRILFVWNWNIKLWLAVFTLSHLMCELVNLQTLKKYSGDTMIEWWYQVFVLFESTWFEDIMVLMCWLQYSCTMVFKEYSKVFQTIQKYHHGRKAITVAWYVLFGLMDNNILNRQIQLAYKMWRFALTPFKALYFLIGNSCCPLVSVFSMKYEWALFFCWNRCLKTLSKIRNTSNQRPLLVNTSYLPD